MKAVVQLCAGDPQTSMAVRNISVPSAPKPGHVVMAVDLASVHHGDLFIARLDRPLPPDQGFFLSGSEAVGRITQLSDDVAAHGEFKIGDRAATFIVQRAWAEQIDGVVDEDVETTITLIEVGICRATVGFAHHIEFETVRPVSPPPQLVAGSSVSTARTPPRARPSSRVRPPRRFSARPLRSSSLRRFS